MFKFKSELATDKRFRDTNNQNSLTLESGLSEHFRLRGNWKLQPPAAIVDCTGMRSQLSFE